MNLIAWMLFALFCGSIPFSLLVGRVAGAEDIREVGDGNPGATNVLRATNWRWFTLALLLDYLKGTVPVGTAWFLAELDGWRIVPIALAPVLGHAFSPWLRFQGGKAVAVTFGVWTGLTLGTGPIVLGLLLVLMFVTVEQDSWALVLAFLLFGIFIGRYFGPYFPEFIWVWAGNMGILLWTHSPDLSRRPALNSVLLARFRKPL